jgi:hypothetical protein
VALGHICSHGFSFLPHDWQDLKALLAFFQAPLIGLPRLKESFEEIQTSGIPLALNRSAPISYPKREVILWKRSREGNYLQSVK